MATKVPSNRQAGEAGTAKQDSPKLPIYRTLWVQVSMAMVAPRRWVTWTRHAGMEDWTAEPCSETSPEEWPHFHAFAHPRWLCPLSCSLFGRWFGRCQ